MNQAAALTRPGEDTAIAPSGLDVRSIAKSYDRRAVLHDVSLAVHRGEVVGLLGPNGAGKTTCFYSVMGLVKPDAGRIFLDGDDITELPMYRRAILGLGYLPQETSIFRGLTVEQNILAVLEVEETWIDDNGAWYCRELFRADVRADRIAELSVYCTGDWDSAQIASHAAEVTLLRP